MTATRHFTSSTTRNLPALALVRAKDPALRRVADTITTDDQWREVTTLGPRMQATLRARPNGLALAAPQVGRSLRLVVDVQGRAIANPRVVDVTGDLAVGVEGCLSLPGQFFDVPRFAAVVVEGVDARTGDVVRLEERDDVCVPWARLWQHECDHLDGLLLLGRFPITRRS